MASLEQLKKRLRSVELTKQLTNAMKTASSAKYSKINKLNIAYSKYANECEKLSSCVTDIERNNSVSNAKDCYLIVGYNRGLCGAYNYDLHSFSAETLQALNDFSLIVTGKNAVNYFTEKGYDFTHFETPDVPSIDSASPLLDEIYSLYASGQAPNVYVIYQSFINTMTQKPVVKKLLPFDNEEITSSDNVLWLPDKQSVNRDLHHKLFLSRAFKILIEGALGAQAATLMAMRTAVDHANDTQTKLNIEIQKKRQSAVTTSVIETSSGASNSEEV